MYIPFEYPVVDLDDDDPENGEITYREGKIKPLNLDTDPYEMILKAEGFSFHLIFGRQINGHFLCIPDWHFGCELARLSDIGWNMNAILYHDSLLDYEDVTAITYSLNFISQSLK